MKVPPFDTQPLDSTHEHESEVTPRRRRVRHASARLRRSSQPLFLFRTRRLRLPRQPPSSPASLPWLRSLTMQTTGNSSDAQANTFNPTSRAQSAALCFSAVTDLQNCLGRCCQPGRPFARQRRAHIARLRGGQPAACESSGRSFAHKALQPAARCERSRIPQSAHRAVQAGPRSLNPNTLHSGPPRLRHL